MLFLYWILMTLTFLLTKTVTKGRLRCNVLTAAIAAALILGITFGVVKLLVTILVPLLPSKSALVGIVWLAGMMITTPLATLLTFAICCILLPGFNVTPLKLTETEFKTLKQRYRLPSAEDTQKLWKLISRTPSKKKKIQSLFVCSSVYIGLLYAVSMGGPIFGFVILFIIYAFVAARAVPSAPNSTRFHSRYDMFNPNSAYNLYHPFRSNK